MKTWEQQSTALSGVCSVNSGRSVHTLRRQTKCFFFGPMSKGPSDLWILMLHLNNLLGVPMDMEYEGRIRSRRFPPATFAPPTRL